MAYLIQNTRTDDFIDDSGDWTMIRSFAKKFSSQADAQRYIDQHQTRNDDSYMKVVKESTKTVFHKTLKENMKALKEDQQVVIHTKNGKVDSIEQGTYMPNGVFIRNGGHSFDKGFIGMDPQAAKDSLVKFSHYDPKNIIIEGCKKIDEDTPIYPADLKVGDVFHMSKNEQDKKSKSYKVVKVDNDNIYSKSINPNGPDMKISNTRSYKVYLSEGCKKVQEATSNLREGFGELEVYTSFGPGFGVQIYPSRNGELTAHVGYVSNGSGNGTYKKELKTETELKAIDEIKIADLKGIERVLKKHLDALDSDLQKILKQYGYK